MQYIKRFNESIIDKNELDELQQFCEEHLIEMIDNGFIVVVDNSQEDVIKTKIYIKHRESKKTIFQWDKIKDYIIPFINVLNDNYKIDEILLSNVDDKFNVSLFNKSAKKIINDKVNDSTVVGKITITIVNKKEFQNSFKKRISRFFKT